MKVFANFYDQDKVLVAKVVVEPNVRIPNRDEAVIVKHKSYRVESVETVLYSLEDQDTSFISGIIVNLHKCQ